MTDQLEKMFAELRAETLPTVRPPGASLARRTVRRRRVVSASAGVAAVIVIAGVAGLPRGGVESQPTGSVVETITADPDMVATARIQRVQQAIGLDTIIGRGNVGTLSGNGEHNFTQYLIGGTYLVKVACSGPGGKATVIIDTAAFSVRCAQEPQPVLTSVQVAGPGAEVTVRAFPQGEAGQNSELGYQMELSDPDGDRLANKARAALPGGAGALIDSRFGDAVLGVDAPPMGSSRVSFSCVGTGTVSITADLVENEDLTTPLRSTEMTCGPAAVASSFTITVPVAGAKRLELNMTPNAEARGQAATALQVSPA